MGETLSWKNGAIWASITAIYPDGSETPASDPVHLEPPAPAHDRSP